MNDSKITCFIFAQLAISCFERTSSKTTRSKEITADFLLNFRDETEIIVNYSNLEVQSSETFRRSRNCLDKISLYRILSLVMHAENFSHE
jgi:hypothetical protein